MDGERYAPMAGIQCEPETISQLTTFGIWNHVESKSQTSGLSLMNNPMPPCKPPAAVGASLKDVTL